MIKKIIFLVIIMVVILFFSLKFVGFFDSNEIKVSIGTDEKDKLKLGVSTEKVEKEVIEKAGTLITACSDNSECGDKKCINSVCKAIEELYDESECKRECNYNSAEILTSDGEILTLKNGQSSYTAAGALAWKLLPGPDYCKGVAAMVPIEIEKINLGKILQKQVITVKLGETSPVITHPNIDKIKYTIKILNVEEVCS